MFKKAVSIQSLPALGDHRPGIWVAPPWTNPPMRGAGVGAATGAVAGALLDSNGWRGGVDRRLSGRPGRRSDHLHRRHASLAPPSPPAGGLNKRMTAGKGDPHHPVRSTSNNCKIVKRALQTRTPDVQGGGARGSATRAPPPQVIDSTPPSGPPRFPAGLLAEGAMFCRRRVGAKAGKGPAVFGGDACCMAVSSGVVPHWPAGGGDPGPLGSLNPLVPPARPGPSRGREPMTRVCTTPTAWPTPLRNALAADLGVGASCVLPATAPPP